jgi:hypothetical protein
MNPYHPAYVPAMAHMEDLQRDAAAARLTTVAKPRRQLGTLIRSTTLRLRSIRPRVIGPNPGKGTLVALALMEQHSDSASSK